MKKRKTPPRGGDASLRSPVTAAASPARLWDSYIGQAHEKKRLPAFDRWLSAELRARGAQGQERERLAGELFALMRFAPLAIFLERAFVRLSKGFLWQSRRRIPSKAPVEWLAEYRTQEPAPLWEQVRGLSGANLVTWAALRAGFARHDEQRLVFFEAMKPILAESKELEDRLLWHGIPAEFSGELKRRATASAWRTPDLDRFVEAQATAPTLWLRLNQPEYKAEILEELRAAKLNPREDETGAIAVRGPTSIYELASFQDGRLEIQDLASQAIGQALGARPGERIWDCCAGEGGKTLQLAAALGGKGFVYASDNVDRKLENLKLRVRRTGISNVRILGWDGERLPEFGIEVQGNAGFDAVLVDAPCSSSGTWRRNPDAKFRVPPQEIRSFSELQEALLGSAARAVRVGGRLVYGTCSWFVGENEDVVARFLARNADFELRQMSFHGCPAADADTMFSAVLIRRA